MANYTEVIIDFKNKYPGTKDDSDDKIINYLYNNLDEFRILYPGTKDDSDDKIKNYLKPKKSILDKLTDFLSKKKPYDQKKELEAKKDKIVELQNRLLNQKQVTKILNYPEPDIVETATMPFGIEAPQTTQRIFETLAPDQKKAFLEEDKDKIKQQIRSESSKEPSTPVLAALKGLIATLPGATDYVVPDEKRPVATGIGQVAGTLGQALGVGALASKGLAGAMLPNIVKNAAVRGITTVATSVPNELNDVVQGRQTFKNAVKNMGINLGGTWLSMVPEYLIPAGNIAGKLLNLVGQVGVDNTSNVVSDYLTNPEYMEQLKNANSDDKKKYIIQKIIQAIPSTIFAVKDFKNPNFRKEQVAVFDTPKKVENILEPKQLTIDDLRQELKPETLKFTEMKKEKIVRNPELRESLIDKLVKDDLYSIHSTLKDPKTGYLGIYNGQNTDAVVNKLIDISKKRNIPATLIDMDFINQKGVNNLFGGQTKIADEKVLHPILKIMVDIFRKNNINVIRTGGDEFLAVAIGLQKQDVNSIVNNIKNDVNTFLKNNNYQNIPVGRTGEGAGGTTGIRFGIQELDDTIKNSDDFVKKASQKTELEKKKEVSYGRIGDETRGIQGPVRGGLDVSGKQKLGSAGRGPVTSGDNTAAISKIPVRTSEDEKVILQRAIKELTDYQSEGTPMRIPVRDDEGTIMHWTRIGGERPDWAKNKPYQTKEIIRAFEKKISDKPLQKRQQVIVDELLDQLKFNEQNEIEHYARTDPDRQNQQINEAYTTIRKRTDYIERLSEALRTQNSQKTIDDITKALEWANQDIKDNYKEIENLKNIAEGKEVKLSEEGIRKLKSFGADDSDIELLLKKGNAEILINKLLPKNRTSTEDSQGRLPGEYDYEAHNRVYGQIRRKGLEELNKLIEQYTIKPELSGNPKVEKDLFGNQYIPNAKKPINEQEGLFSNLAKPKFELPQKKSITDLVSDLKDMNEPFEGERIKSTESIKRKDIENYLSKELNVPIYRGHFQRPKSVGIYKNRGEIIRIKKGGLPTVTHEIGHHLYKISDIKQFVNLHKSELGALDYEVSKNRPEEGFAEYIRKFITNPKKIEHLSFNHDFYSWLDKKENLNTKNILLNARDNYVKWQNMSDANKIDSHIVSKFETKHKTFKEILRATIIETVNDLYPVKEIQRVAEKTGYKENVYHSLKLLDGVVNGTFESWVKGDKRVNVKGEVIGDSLEKILKPIENNMPEFVRYLVVQRGKEVLQKGKEVGLEKEVLDREYDRLQKLYPEFEKYAQNIYAYNKDLIDYLKDSGVINTETYTKIVNSSGFYVPLMRAHDELMQQGRFGKGLISKNPIKRMHGSELEIINPIESMIRMTRSIIDASEKNKVMTELVNVVKMDKDLTRLIEQVPVPQTVIRISSDELGADLKEKYVDIFRPAFYNSDNIITILENGKKSAYQIHDTSLYNILNGVNRKEQNFLEQVLQFPTRVLKTGATTLSADFAFARNPARDVFTSWLYSRYSWIPGENFVRGLVSAISKDKDYWDWMRHGGAQSSFLALSNKELENKMIELNKKFNWKDLNPLRLLEQIANTFEQTTRLGEYKGLKKRGYTSKEAAVHSRDVTQDFAIAGATIRWANQYIPFLSANIGGFSNFTEQIKKNPAVKWKLLMLMSAGASLTAINNQDKRYGEIDNYEKDTHWLIMVNPIIRIPKPPGLPMFFASIPEHIIKNKEMAKDLFSSLYQSTSIDLTPAFIKPALENIANFSFYRKAPLESFRMEQLEPKDRYNEFTSEIAKKVGKVFNTSPIKLENLFRGHLGTAGGNLLKLTDLLLEKENKLPIKLSDIPILKAFIEKNPISGQSKSLKDFYNKVKAITLKYTSTKLDIKNAQKFSENDLKHIATYKIMSDYFDAVKKYMTKRDYILNNKDLSRKAKQAEIDDVYKTVISLVQKANSIYDFQNKKNITQKAFMQYLGEQNVR